MKRIVQQAIAFQQYSRDIEATALIPFCHQPVDHTAQAERNPLNPPQYLSIRLAMAFQQARLPIRLSALEIAGRHLRQRHARAAPPKGNERAGALPCRSGYPLLDLFRTTSQLRAHSAGRSIFSEHQRAQHDRQRGTDPHIESLRAVNLRCHLAHETRVAAQRQLRRVQRDQFHGTFRPHHLIGQMDRTVLPTRQDKDARRLQCQVRPIVRNLLSQPRHRSAAV